MYQEGSKRLIIRNKKDFYLKNKKNLFLGFTTQNDFVDEAVERLKSECQGGKLTGILTKHQTTAYLVVFKREVIASGYCNMLEG